MNAALLTEMGLGDADVQVPEQVITPVAQTKTLAEVIDGFSHSTVFQLIVISCVLMNFYMLVK